MTIEKAKELLMLGEVDKAERILLNLARSDKNNVSAWLLLCGISMRKKNWTLGVESFEYLVALRPTNPLASSGLVQSYFNTGQYEEALKEITRFSESGNFESEDAKIVLNEHQKTANAIQEIKSKTQ